MYGVWTPGAGHCQVRMPVEPNFKAGPRQEASSCQPPPPLGHGFPVLALCGGRQGPSS